MTLFADTAPGAYIFLGFVLFFLLAIVIGYYTRSGSGINQRPHDGREGSMGAKGASSISTADGTVERTVGTRGTR